MCDCGNSFTLVIPFPLSNCPLCVFSLPAPLSGHLKGLSLSLLLSSLHTFSLFTTGLDQPGSLSLRTTIFFIYVDHWRHIIGFFLSIISLTWWSIPESVLRKLPSVLTQRGGKLCVTSSRQRGKVRLSLTDSVSQSVIMVTHCVNLTCSLAAFLEETCLCLSSPLCAQPQLHFLISFLLGNVLPSL